MVNILSCLALAAGLVSAAPSLSHHHHSHDYFTNNTAAPSVAIAGPAQAQSAAEFSSDVRYDSAIRSALSYSEFFGTTQSRKHKGKHYVIDTPNIEAWKDQVFPEAEIAVDLVWNVTHGNYGPDGTYRSGFYVNGQSPGPSVVAKENDWIRIVVNNFLPVPITIHFHGIDQAYTPWSDGMPGITQYPVLSGGSYAYIFQFKNQHGAFWYHAHFRGYAMDGLFGPMHIIAADDVERPYEKIEGITQSDLDLIYQLEKKPTNLIVADGYPIDSDDVLVRLFHDAILPTCAQSVLINGKGRITCLPTDDITAASKIRGNTFLGFPVAYDAMGCGAGALVGDAANSKALGVGGYSGCSPTDTDREIIYTNGQKFFYFNVYNMAPETSKIFSIDEHDLIVISADGMFVEPKVVQQLILPLATRFTVLVRAKETAKDGDAFSIRFASHEVFQVIEGVAYLVYGNPVSDETFYQSMNDSSSQRTQDIGGSLVSSSGIAVEFEDLTPLGDSYLSPTGSGDHTVHLLLNNTNGIHFSLFQEKTLFLLGAEMDAPYLLQTDPAKLDFDNIPAAVAPGIKLGDIVDLVIDNTLLLNHPFHMHGHSFSVISKSHNETFKYASVAEALEAAPETINFETAPYVDTVVVPTNGHVVIRFKAHNPGYWFMHCHIDHHLAAGMGGFLVVDPERIPRIPLALYDQPHAEYDSNNEINVSQDYGSK